MNENFFELTFLGTCACDFSPRLKTYFKDCFDKDARRSSAVLVNGRFLIDCGIHTVESLAIAKKPLSGITDIFITHLHRDHFNKDNIETIASERETPVRLWVSEDTDIAPVSGVTVIKMTPFEKYYVEDGLSVTGLPANHDPLSKPQHFIFEGGGKKIFYGCDGGWLLNATYNFLRKAKLDLAVLDCTTGDYLGDFRMAEHNSIPMIRLMLPSLMTVGAIDADTRVFLSHLAPSLHKPHAETAAIAEKFGATVAYDGLEIKI